MSSIGDLVFRCFLCQRKNYLTCTQKPIDENTLLPSRKSVKTALDYFIKKCGCSELPLNVQLCSECFDQLTDYDTAALDVLRKQKKLIELVESACGDVIDSDVENDCNEHMSTMEEINNSNFFDDIIESEDEIERTVSEVFGVSQKRKRENEENQDDIPVAKMKHFFQPTLHCPLCTMRFRSKMRLEKHILRAHKKFKCEICEYSHRNKDYVKLHMNTHEGRSETCCLFCQKQFSSKISTIRHMEAHINDKKYQCDKCGLCFSQTTNLNNHKMQHEAEEQPLQCNICNQMFKTKRTYRHHMWIHRPDRPRYCCEFCQKTFTEKYTLKVHKRSHPEAAEATFERNANIDTPNVPMQPILSTPEVGSTVQVQSTTFIESTVIPVMNVEGKLSCIICDEAFCHKEHMNSHMEKEHDIILKSLTL